MRDSYWHIIIFRGEIGEFYADKNKRIFGADIKIDSIAPLYIQFKRSLAYPEFSSAKFLKERKKLNLSNSPIGRSEDDLIDYVFFNNFELGWLPCPEKLSEGRIITRIFKIGLNRFLMKLKKALKRVNRNFFVFCLVPSDTSDINVKMFSDVIDDSSISPK